ncbi:hypothetical protein PoMZ_08669 [Pyricularia oryzae]|uniref:Uncharacterized protein n=1 Tax=Pyricularia oryzae TaxID=318829 RepID=A0A4P7NI92_PYROR|nr:hypothetical protein PoMZ_08669 [Pyricularia oryzae]
MFDREIIQINYIILLKFWKRLVNMNENAPIYFTQENLDFFKRNFRIRAYRNEYTNFKNNCFPKIKKQTNRI